MIDIMLRFLYAKGTSQDDESSKAKAIQIPLTFRTDINIANLANGKGIPALSVKLFRLADFLMLNDLVANAEAVLRNHLDKLLAIPDGDDSDIKSTPARVLEMTEVFEAIREAYKGTSTDHIQKMLLSFLWMRNGNVFQLPEVTVLLEEIPEIGKDLMRVYISGSGTAHINDTSKPPTGLLVLKAVRSPDLIYRKPKRTKGGDTETRCVLRHTPGRPSPFEAVDERTGALIKDLAWITPATCQISMISSYETSEIVCVVPWGPDSDKKSLYLRFETPGDARYYAGCHSGVDREVKQDRTTKTTLQVGMEIAYAQHRQVSQP